MSEVKRYTVHYYDGAGEIPDGDGEYVYFSDYDALRTELERVIKDRDAHADLSERMKVALNRIGTKDSYVEWAKECRKTYDDLQTVTQQRDEAVKLLAQWSRQHQSDALNEAPPPILETEKLLTRIKGETT